MHGDIFRYIMLLSAVVFVAIITFDTDQRHAKWGHEIAASKAAAPSIKRAATGNIKPADSATPATAPKVAKDI